MKYKYLIIDEDGTPRGTNNEECAKAFGDNNCATLVLNLETWKLRFEGQDVGEVEEQSFNPEEWK